MERHVLVILPHPDDESFSCGGTVALLTREGTPVTYLCATRGEMGRNMGKPIIANRETIPEIRDRELREACNILGIREIRYMNRWDKTMEFEDPADLADQIAETIADLKPSRILMHYPGHGVHPDHNALAAAVALAASRMPAADRPALWGAAVGRNREQVVAHLGEPNHVVDIREVVEQKISAVEAHRSQTSNREGQFRSRMAEDTPFRHIFQREMFWDVPVATQG